MAHPTAIPANKMKSKPSILCISLCPLWFRLPSPQRTQRSTNALTSPTGTGPQKLSHVIEQTGPLNRCGHDDVDNRERHQEFPAKTHQLIEPESRQSPT